MTLPPSFPFFQIPTEVRSSREGTYGVRALVPRDESTGLRAQGARDRSGPRLSRLRHFEDGFRFAHHRRIRRQVGAGRPQGSLAEE